MCVEKWRKAMIYHYYYSLAGSQLRFSLLNN